MTNSNPQLMHEQPQIEDRVALIDAGDEPVLGRENHRSGAIVLLGWEGHPYHLGWMLHTWLRK